MLNQLKLKIKKTKFILLIYLIKKIFYKIYAPGKKNIIQLAYTTKLDRHPDLFEFAKENLKILDDVNILSFGCSRGDECITISNYFSDAYITGLDINPDNINYAKSHNKKNKITYLFLDITNDDNYVNTNNFHIIFALSVLCLEPEAKYTNNLSLLFNFNTFEKIIIKFDKMLKKNGLFILKNSNYRFEDTSVFKKYKSLYYQKSNFPTFDINGQKIKDNNEMCFIFQKCS